MCEIQCSNCNKIFKYDICDDKYPGCREKEEIFCPYCHKIAGYEMTSGIVRSFPISQEDSVDKN